MHTEHRAPHRWITKYFHSANLSAFCLRCAIYAENTKTNEKFFLATAATAVAVVIVGGWCWSWVMASVGERATNEGERIEYFVKFQWNDTQLLEYALHAIAINVWCSVCIRECIVTDYSASNVLVMSLFHASVCCAVCRLLSNPNTVRRRHCNAIRFEWFCPMTTNSTCLSLSLSLCVWVWVCIFIVWVQCLAWKVVRKEFPIEIEPIGILLPPVCTLQVHASLALLHCRSIDAGIDSNDQFCSSAMCDAHTIGRMNAAAFIPKQNRALLCIVFIWVVQVGWLLLLLLPLKHHIQDSQWDIYCDLH